MRGARSFSAAAVVVVGCLLLTSCGSSNDGATPDADMGPRAGGALVDLQNFARGDADHIDPALAATVQESQIAELVYDGLTETGAQGEIRNAVAQEVTKSDDARSWTFRLRDDVRFDNNDVVRPSDFKFAWERVADPALASEISYHLASIAGFADVASGSVKTLNGVVADDASRTLTVNLSEPRQDFASVVSLPVFSPLPKRVFDAAGAGSTTYTRWEDGAMVGNGPFAMAKPWERGRAITLARSDTYYGGPDGSSAYLDTIEFRISNGVDSAFTDFEGGGGQVGRIPPGRYQDINASRGDDVVNTSTLGTEMWTFNMRSPAVGGPDNLKLRQAIASATDKADVVAKVYGGSRPVASGVTPPAMPGYDGALAQPERNVERARQLLREWGRTPPALQISFVAGAGHDDKATILSQNLAEIGITATPNPLDGPALGQAVRAGSLDMFWRNWTADYVTYDNFIAPNFSTATLGQDNVSGYSNPSLDALVNAARADSDATAANRIYRDAERLVLGDQVVVPLTWTTAGLVKAPDVQALRVSPLGYVAYDETWLTR